MAILSISFFNASIRPGIVAVRDPAVKYRISGDLMAFRIGLGRFRLGNNRLDRERFDLVCDEDRRGQRHTIPHCIRDRLAVGCPLRSLAIRVHAQPSP